MDSPADVCGCLRALEDEEAGSSPNGYWSRGGCNWQVCECGCHGATDHEDACCEGKCGGPAVVAILEAATDRANAKGASKEGPR